MMDFHGDPEMVREKFMKDFREKAEANLARHKALVSQKAKRRRERKRRELDEFLAQTPDNPLRRARRAGPSSAPDSSPSPSPVLSPVSFPAPLVERKPQPQPKPPTPGRPLWMPEGTEWEALPPELRQATDEIVEPAYKQLVLQVPPGLERSLGVSLVHLLWLEILDQFDIKRDSAESAMFFGKRGANSSSIDHHIRLLDAKLRHGRFMLRLEEFRREMGKKRGMSCLGNEGKGDKDEPDAIRAEEALKLGMTILDFDMTGEKPAFARQGNPGSPLRETISVERTAKNSSEEGTRSVPLDR
jgi:hypothetical protein